MAETVKTPDLAVEDGKADRLLNCLEQAKKDYEAARNTSRGGRDPNSLHLMVAESNLRRTQSLYDEAVASKSNKEETK